MMSHWQISCWDKSPLSTLTPPCRQGNPSGNLTKKKKHPVHLQLPNDTKRRPLKRNTHHAIRLLLSVMTRQQQKHHHWPNPCHVVQPVDRLLPVVVVWIDSSVSTGLRKDLMVSCFEQETVILETWWLWKSWSLTRRRMAFQWPVYERYTHWSMSSIPILWM